MAAWLGADTAAALGHTLCNLVCSAQLAAVPCPCLFSVLQLLADNLSQHRLTRLAATADCVTLPAQLLVAMADPSALPGEACVAVSAGHNRVHAPAPRGWDASCLLWGKPHTRMPPPTHRPRLNATSCGSVHRCAAVHAAVLGPAAARAAGGLHLAASGGNEWGHRYPGHATGGAPAGEQGVCGRAGASQHGSCACMRMAVELACAPSTRPTPSAHQHPRTPYAPLPQHLAAPHIAFLRTLRNSIASWLTKGTMAADAAVHALLGSSTGLSSRAAAAYWVVSLCWVFGKRLAGIYAIC